MSSPELVYVAHIPSFVVKRALRIYPAYIVVLLVTTFIVGPLVSTLSTSDYFSSSLVSIMCWAMRR